MQYHRSPLVKIENRNKFFCILVLHKRKISLLSIMTWTFPANTPRGFLIETTWKRSFPRHFNVESTWYVYRVMSLYREIRVSKISYSCIFYKDFIGEIQIFLLTINYINPYSPQKKPLRITWRTDKIKNFHRECLCSISKTILKSY